MDNFCLLRQSHSHAKHENRALALAIRVATDFATSVLHYLLANSETQPDSFDVESLLTVSFFNFAKKCKQLLNIFRFNTTTLVNHLHVKLLILAIVTSLNTHRFTLAKLKCIFYQVDQNLLKAKMVTDQCLGQTYQLSIKIIIRCLDLPRALQLFDCFENDWRIHHFRLLFKDAGNKFKCLTWLKWLVAFDKAILVDHFKIEDVIDQAQKKVHLRDDHEDYVSLGLICNAAQQTLKQHQGRAQRSSKLM